MSEHTCKPVLPTKEWLKILLSFVIAMIMFAGLQMKILASYASEDKVEAIEKARIEDKMELKEDLREIKEYLARIVRKVDDLGKRL